MQATIKIQGLEKAAETARAILEHVEAIQALQKDAAWTAIKVDVQMDEAASGN